MDLDRVVEEIENKLDITNVIGRYVKLRKTGRNHVGLCPFHPEKTPSFTVSPDKGFFYCFGCKAGGNVVHFLSKIEGLTYMEALKQLADEAGVEFGEIKHKPKLDKEYELLSKVCDYFHKQLKVNKVALDYLIRRGVDDKTIGQFKLGYSPGNRSYLPKVISEMGFDLKLAEKLSLIGKSESGSVYGYMSDRIIFPIVDHRNRVVAFGGRSVGDGEPKYINSSSSAVFNKSRTLFGINIAKRNISKTSHVIVTEGYMDVISMHMSGFKETVSTLGTAFTDDHARILRRFTNLVYLFFDSDSAGKNASIGAIQVCLRQGLECRVMSAENGKDPDDVASEGATSVELLMEDSTEAIDFVLEHLVSVESNPNSPTTKSRIVKKAINIANCSPDSLVRSSYRDKIASAMDVPKSAINNYTKSKPRVSLNVTKSRIGYERRIIKCACRDSNLAKKILNVASAEYFKDERCREIFKVVKKLNGDVFKLEEEIKSGKVNGELISVIAGMLITENDEQDENLFIDQVISDVIRFDLEVLHKRYKNGNLTQIDFERYLTLQRKVRGTKRSKEEKGKETAGRKGKTCKEGSVQVEKNKEENTQSNHYQFYESIHQSKRQTSQTIEENDREEEDSAEEEIFFD
jgi:DNA primase